MTIKQHLSYGIGTVIFLVALNATIGSINSHSVSTLVERTSTESVPQALQATNAKFQTCEMQQFLTDASLTQENGSVEEADKAYASFVESMNAFETMFKKEGNIQALAEVDSLKKDAAALIKAGKAMKAAYAHSDSEGDTAMAQFDQMSQKLAENIDKLKDTQVKEASDSLTTAKDKSSSSTTITFFLGVFSTLIGLLVAYLTTSIIGKTVRALNENVHTMVTNKDLTHVLTLPGKNELTEVADNINALTNALRETFATAQHSSAENLSVATELSATTLSIGRQAEDALKSLLRRQKMPISSKMR